MARHRYEPTLEDLLGLAVWVLAVEIREASDRIVRALRTETGRITEMATDLTALAAEVAQNTDVTASAEAVLADLVQQLKDAGGNQEAIDALTAQLDANTANLAAAIASSEPAPEPTP